VYECIILYRIKGGEYVEVVRDPEDPHEIAVWPHIDSAIAYCNTNFRDGKANYQIVELDEL
jgi:hypothetical protein